MPSLPLTLRSLYRTLIENLHDIDLNAHANLLRMGHSSLVDADKVDGKHLSQLVQNDVTTTQTLAGPIALDAVYGKSSASGLSIGFETTQSSGYLLKIVNGTTAKISVDYQGNVTVNGNLTVNGTTTTINTTNTTITDAIITLNNGYSGSSTAVSSGVEIDIHDTINNYKPQLLWNGNTSRWEVKRLANSNASYKIIDQNDYGHTAGGTGINADMVDGYHESDVAKRQSNSATISTTGWYRIAINSTTGALGNSGGSRAHATFTVRDTTSGYHSAVTFIASCHFGAQPTLVCLGRSTYANSGRIKAVRIVSKGTYDGAAVEVYVDGSGTSANVDYTIYDNEHTYGWAPVDWTVSDTPVDWTQTVIDFTNSSSLNAPLAIATDGSANANFIVKRDGSVVGKQLTSTVATGTAPLSVSSTTLVSNLNVDMVDTYHVDSSTSVPSSDAVSRSISAFYTDGSSTNYLAKSIIYQLTDKIGVGITNPTAKLHVGGDLKVDSAATLSNTLTVTGATTLNSDLIVKGNTTLGDSNDTTTVNGTLSVTGNITGNQLISTVATGTAPLSVSSTTKITNLNADMVDGYHAGNSSGQVPVSNGTLNTNLNADMVDGYNAGNLSGQVPVSNGTLNTNLNADMLDGYHASATATASTIPVSDSTGKINNAWLNTGSGNGIDADMIDGYHAGNSSGQVSVNNGTLNTNLNADMLDGYHATATATASTIPVSSSTGKLSNAWLNTGSGNGIDADMLDGYHAGNSSGQVPISNGTLNTNLNADMLDGFHASTVSIPGHWIPVTDINGKLDPSWLPDSNSGLNVDLLAYLDLHDSGILNSNWVLRDSNGLPKYWYINNPSNLTLTINNITNNDAYIENVMTVEFMSNDQYIEITSEVMPIDAFNNNYYKLAFFAPPYSSAYSEIVELTISHIYYDSNNTPHESICFVKSDFEVHTIGNPNSILKYNVNGGTTYYHHHDTILYYNYAKLKIKLKARGHQTINIATVKRNSNDFSYRTITGEPLTLTGTVTNAGELVTGKIIDNIKIRNIDISDYGRLYIPDLYWWTTYNSYMYFSFKNDFNNIDNFAYVYLGSSDSYGLIFGVNLPQTLLPFNTSDFMSTINTALYVTANIEYYPDTYKLSGASKIYLLSPRVYQQDGTLYVNNMIVCQCQCTTYAGG